MIGYDIDGVLAPDVDPEDFDSIEQMLEFRTKVWPIFQPKPPYCLITGRPLSDYHYTKKWVQAKFEHQPERIFHDNTDYNFGEVYKADVLNQRSDIEVFIESCQYQVNYLRKHTKTKIVWIGDLISENILRLPNIEGNLL